jgi:cellulose synthase/poly-beta-1,6-N-acetylglucosamine synthase-like glycosyltransferase
MVPDIGAREASAAPVLMSAALGEASAAPLLNTIRALQAVIGRRWPPAPVPHRAHLAPFADKNRTHDAAETPRPHQPPATPPCNRPPDRRYTNFVISFVIPAWNEQLLLGRTIESIHAAMDGREHPYEIVVADDASTDDTAAVARAGAARVVTCHHRQIAATRNSGARAALGDRLIVIDAETVVPRAVVDEILIAFDQGCAAGGAMPIFDDPVPRYARLLLMPMGLLYRVLGLASGACLMCTRATFEAIGGFDESRYAAEEAVFCRRAHRFGRFVLVRTPVVTSGRKLRTFSALEILAALIRLSLPPLGGTRRRHAIWYDQRRPDPSRPDVIAPKPRKSALAARPPQDTNLPDLNAD